MTLAENLDAVRKKIKLASMRSGGQEVTLVAVSKNFSARMVGEAAEAGQVHFGENRIQEARAKIPLAPPGLTWHLVGTLQRNKVRDAVLLFNWIHSVDSLKLAREIERRLDTLEKKINILIEVKLSPEETKFGVDPAGVMDLVREMRQYEHLVARGLMTVAPFGDDPEMARPFFRQLSRLGYDIREALDLPDFDQLSMGMSEDYEVAVEEGATMVRIGTAVFGRR